MKLRYKQLSKAQTDKLRDESIDIKELLFMLNSDLNSLSPKSLKSLEKTARMLKAEGLQLISDKQLEKVVGMPGATVSENLDLTRKARSQRALIAGFKAKKWYHWSPNSFDAFDTNRSDLGAHFGTFEQARYRANVFGGKEEDIKAYRIRGSSFLRLKDVGSFHADGIALQMEKKGLLKKGEGRQIEKEIEKDWKLRKKYDPYLKGVLIAAEYTGIIYKNTHEGAGDSLVILRSEDIRSVDAAFDPKHDKGHGLTL